MAEMEKPGACGGGRASGQRASGRPAQAPDSCDQPERQTIVIVVAPVGRGKFSASYLGRVLVVSSNIPFCDAARALAGEGVDPATRIVMRHEGKDYDALTSTVAAAAKLTVKESTRDGKPRFGDWHPYGGPCVPVASPISETEPAGVEDDHRPDAPALPAAGDAP
jgi:hypothetical protein